MIATPRLCLCAVLCALLYMGPSGCHDSAETSSDNTAALLHNRPLLLHAFDEPHVSWDAERAATDVVVKFVARLADGTPLSEGDVQVTLLLDGAPLDSEAILQAGAKAREVNLLYSMVLDATRSMLLHTPPAFEPMKEAAMQSVKTGNQIWADRPGTFAWGVSWFDDYVYRPLQAWPEEALLSIAPPAAESFTRLYSAVDFAIDDLPRLRAQAGLERAHHVMVVFTDGHDNHPTWNPAFAAERVEPASGFAFERIAWPTVSHGDLLEKIRANKELTVHTIGMGSDIDEAALRALAQAGRGIYVNNARGASIASLFARVTREFTTIQSSGATIPNPPGDYELTVQVTAHHGAGSGRLTMRLHIGDDGARSLTAPIAVNQP